jgi:NAD(P)-dependent dehydrogenase (short-subunit alcohol dehydrogenase family)
VENLEGKVVVITGAASGIGLAMAHRFAAEGMKLVLSDVEAKTLETAVAGLPAGTEVVSMRCDVSKGEQVDALRDFAVASYGSVHLVCNNAGVGSGGAMAELNLTDWEWVLGVNLWGVIHGVRAFLPLLVEQGEGHIVNTASVAGLFAAPYMGAYNVSKYGVVALSETLFNELAMANPNVHVSVLCPSWVKTNIATATRNHPDGEPADAGAIAEVIETFISRGIEPADVADQVAEAVKVNRFWIITHEDTPAAVTQRMESILQDGTPPMLMH